MLESRVRAIVGLFLVASQFGLMLLVIFLFAVPRPRGFTFEEMTTTLGIFLPAFAAYTVPITRHIVDNRYKKTRGRQVDGLFVTLAFALPMLFAAIVAGCTLLKAFGYAFENFEQFKTFLGIIQSAFAVYVGLFVTSLFESREPKAQAAPAAPVD